MSVGLFLKTFTFIIIAWECSLPWYKSPHIALHGKDSLVLRCQREGLFMLHEKELRYLKTLTGQGILKEILIRIVIINRITIY